MSVNLVEMEAWNIAQWYAISFVFNSVTLPPQHMGNFSRPLEMMQCQEHKPFAGTKCFLKAKPLLKMSSAADGQSNQRLTVKMVADLVNMNQETVRLILTEELGMRKICAKMVPSNLTEQQRDLRLSAVLDI